VGDGDRDIRDVAHLAGQIAGHEVDRVGQVLPGAGDPFHIGLAAELAVGSDFARHPRHFAGERIQLIHHGDDVVLELEDFTLDVDPYTLLFRSVGDGDRDIRDVAHLAGQIPGHEVDGVGQVLPGAGDAAHVGLPAELAVGADFAR